jgi:1-acyl-sn-glycerol-3-phosphate acyltransferase
MAGFMDSTKPKPESEIYRPEMVRLPRLNRRRRLLRWLLRKAVRLLVGLLTHTQVSGRSNVPRQEAALVVSNHLGDADVLVGAAISPVPIEIIAKIELLDIPIVGRLLEAYGVIWIHRGNPDRRALRTTLEGLEEGRMVAIAPEGRESLSGALEEATGGAAYLALKACVPILPVTFTGTENWRVYENLKRLRRTDVTVTIGQPFKLEDHGNRRIAVRKGTQRIMKALAQQLPPKYQGVYREAIDDR